MEKLISTESNTVTGKAFYNRDIEKKYVREKIERGEPLLLTGQRRTGKSSLLREMGRILEQEPDAWSFLFVDIQSCESGAELVARLAEAVHKHPDFSSKLTVWWRSWLPTTFNAIEEISVGDLSIKLRDSLNPGNWRAKGSALLQKVESVDKRTLVVLDEFPDVINKIYRDEGTVGVETLLDWLRPQAQEFATQKKISLIVSGSIGLEPILQRLGLSIKINHLAVYRLKPWPRPTAKSCFNALASYENVILDEAAVEYFLDQLGIYIPAHIQRCWARLSAHLQQAGKSQATLADAEQVFRGTILRSDSNSMISHYESRLQETLGAEYYSVAIQLLDKMCDGKPLTATKISFFKGKSSNNVDIHYILSVLDHDGYLDKDQANNWIFNDSLLRKWWQQRKQYRKSS